MPLNLRKGQEQALDTIDLKNKVLLILPCLVNRFYSRIIKSKENNISGIRDL